MNSRLTSAIILFVTILWGLSIFYDAINKSYEPPASLNAAFTLVIGGVVASRATGKGQ